ncbi:unnamed protein product [Pleuronectes platessa]|uniref:Uncharacterized protein n=1 Tax=Pleuronectes platessa TaxID=8262 RepID=A0A9N7VWW7_PLEPL|nr:unnamed protein product [Pleuronectes platessa]
MRSAFTRSCDLTCDLKLRAPESQAAEPRLLLHSAASSYDGSVLPRPLRGPANAIKPFQCLALITELRVTPPPLPLLRSRLIILRSESRIAALGSLRFACRRVGLDVFVLAVGIFNVLTFP